MVNIDNDLMDLLDTTKTIINDYNDNYNDDYNDDYLNDIYI